MVAEGAAEAGEEEAGGDGGDGFGEVLSDEAVAGGEAEGGDCIVVICTFYYLMCHRVSAPIGRRPANAAPNSRSPPNLAFAKAKTGVYCLRVGRGRSPEL